MSVGRNDLCECGSGNKYKKCCLLRVQASQADDFVYRRFRDMESKLIPKLFRHGVEVFGPMAIEEAWQSFYCKSDCEAYDPRSPINQIFGPYYLFAWVPDPETTACDEKLDHKTICESFMEMNQSRLSKEELKILASSNRPNFYFYEILDVTPGSSFTLRNILTEIKYEVIEHSGSRGPKRGDILYGAIFEGYGKHQMLAISPYILSPLVKQKLIELRSELKDIAQTKALKEVHLVNFQGELRELFHILVEAQQNAPMPKFVNTDGEELIPQTLHFEISSPEAALSGLVALAGGVSSLEELRLGAKFKDGALYEVEIPWFKSASPNTPQSNTVLGSMKIKGKKLTASVNSDGRAKVLTQKIEALLGSNVKYLTKVIQSIEANLGPEESKGRAGSTTISPDKMPPEVLLAVRKMADEHWKKWFETEIPALNGMTPLKASKSKEGRELLEALLNFYDQKSEESRDLNTNLFEPDIQSLRKKLGMSVPG